ncbi:MAG: hypothetical protein OHK0013_36870 [Sandaracinaceae bacterium]
MKRIVALVVLALLGCESSAPAVASREPLRAPEGEAPLAESSAEDPGAVEPVPGEPEWRIPLGPTQAEEPPRAHEEDNSGVLQFSPADLATSTEGTPPTVWVPFRGLDEADAARLAAQLDLVTWPEEERVATDARYIDDAMAEGPTHARIVLEPRAPLADRWYAIRARLDRGGGLPRLPTRSRPDDYVITDTYALSRFRVGHQPIVQRVDVVTNVEGRALVTVQFSERMRLEREAIPVAVTSDGRALACELASAEEARDEAGGLAVTVRCDGALPGARVAVALTSAPLVAVRTSMVDEVLVHERGGGLVRADGSDGTRDVFELVLPSTPEARIVSPSASDELRAARWYTATVRSAYGLSSGGTPAG